MMESAPKWRTRKKKEAHLEAARWLGHVVVGVFGGQRHRGDGLIDGLAELAERRRGSAVVVVGLGVDVRQA